MKTKRKFIRRGLIFIIILAAATAAIFLTYESARMIYPVEYKEYISEYSAKYDIDPYLILAVIKAESNFNPSAVSLKGARGLMQISVKTGNWGARTLNLANYGNDSLLDPETNIAIGCWYLDVLGKEYGGDLDLLLTAYNAGSGNVNMWLKDKSLNPSGESLDKIPFKETDKYLKRVKRCYTIYKRLYANIF